MISVQFPLGFGRLRRPKSYFPPQILRIALNGPQILRSVGDPPTLGRGAKGKGSSLSQGSYDLGALWTDTLFRFRRPFQNL